MYYGYNVFESYNESFAQFEDQIDQSTQDIKSLTKEFKDLNSTVNQQQQQ